MDGCPGLLYHRLPQDYAQGFDNRTWITEVLAPWREDLHNTAEAQSHGTGLMVHSSTLPTWVGEEKTTECMYGVHRAKGVGLWHEG